MLSKFYAVSAVAAFSSVAQAASNYTFTNTTSSTFVAVHNQCDFDIYYNFSSVGSQPKIGKLDAKHGDVKLPISETASNPHGSVSLGKDETSIEGLAIEWEFLTSNPKLKYRFAMSPNGELLDHRNLLNVSDPKGASTSCRSYNCISGSSKCYYTEEYPVNYMCSTTLDFEATLCA